MSVMTCREFNQKTNLAQKYAESAPVIITHRGKPTFVLLKYEDYQAQKTSRSALEALLDLDHSPDVADIELELKPRSRAQRPPIDFGDD